MSLIKSLGIYKLTADINVKEFFCLINRQDFKEIPMDFGVVISEGFDLKSPEVLLMREVAAKKIPYDQDFTTNLRIRGNALKSLVFDYNPEHYEFFKQSSNIFDRVTLNLTEDMKDDLAPVMKNLENFRANVSQYPYRIRVVLLNMPETDKMVNEIVNGQKKSPGEGNRPFEILHYPGDFDTMDGYNTWQRYLEPLSSGLTGRQEVHEFCGNIGFVNLPKILDLIRKYASEHLRVTAHEKLLTDGKTDLNKAYRYIYDARAWQLSRAQH